MTDPHDLYDRIRHLERNQETFAEALSLLLTLKGNFDRDDAPYPRVKREIAQILSKEKLPDATDC